MLPQYVPAVETVKDNENTAIGARCMMKKEKLLEETFQIESKSRGSSSNSTSSVQHPMQSLLGKRRQAQQEDCLLYCFQLMSVMKISFGDQLLDNYFEVVQNIFGEKNAVSILNRASRSVNSAPIASSDDSSQSTSNNPTLYSTDIQKSRQLLREVHRLIEKRLNIEIQRRIVAFKSCIDACTSLAVLDSSQSLLDFLHGNSVEGESGYYLKTIKEFIGSDNLREIILHSLGKERTKLELIKRDDSETSQEIHTTENNSYEDSFSTSSNPGEEDQPIQSRQQTSHSGLVSIFKTSVLFQVMPQLANLSEKIICIKNFTLHCC